MRLQENIPLAPFTTLKLGGPARYFAEAVTEQDIVEALGFARDRDFPVFILGGGSNLVVHDGGFNGLVLRIALKGIEQSGSTVAAAAGENWDDLVQLAVERNLQGIECLAGIPGTVGGTPVQNVGAYGQEVAQTITEVCVIDRQTLIPHVFNNADCRFAYRQSRFNHDEPNRYIVTRVVFRLCQDGASALHYADLQRAFLPGEIPLLTEVAAKVRQIRAAKGMILLSGDADTQSAGSFFKNPVVPRDVFTKLAEAHPGIPHWPANDGIKLSAAWLLEAAGFHRGFALGRVGLSTRHALALTNRGGATTGELFNLRDRLRAEVAEKFGVILEQEPVELS